MFPLNIVGMNLKAKGCESIEEVMHVRSEASVERKTLLQALGRVRPE